MRTLGETFRMLAYLLAIGAIAALFIPLTGCEQKEKVLDIETPAGGVEVERTEDGKLEIEVEKKGEEPRSHLR